jgi:hypothetical protein
VDVLAWLTLGSVKIVVMQVGWRWLSGPGPRARVAWLAFPHSSEYNQLRQREGRVPFVARISAYKSEWTALSSSTKLLPDLYGPDGHVSNQSCSPVRGENLNYPYSLSSGRRRRRILLGSLLSALSLILVRHLWAPLPYDGFPYLGLEDMLPRKQRVNTPAPASDRKKALLGPPTERFRGMSLPRHPSPHGQIIHSHLDNLRNDTKYLTSWISSGWSEHLPHSLDILLIEGIHQRTMSSHT